MFTDDTSVIPVEVLVSCSPDNPLPCYVVGMFDDTNNINRLGYVYYFDNRKSFSKGYFMEGTDRIFTTSEKNPYNEYYFLVGGNVSFRPHNQVLGRLRFQVGSTEGNKPIYIGTFKAGGEELCGPVINGVCYSNNLGSIRCSQKQEYKILGLNEG
ncbi:Hypothetical predicted protein [Cloeon dipterum]|uniref:Uncharacterized protein n=1 Tax=Cloeon dipterum TaxID=197152 RepID=A0A8S1DUS6_9INSE|nr:Hypothetical predicted protein [Cloeon dipterum]